MAAVLTAVQFPLFLSSLPNSKNRPRRFRCSASSQDGGGGTPPLVTAAVGGVTELLRLLSPKKPRKDTGEAEAVLPRGVEDVVAVLKADYKRAYFLTGNFTTQIYAEDCLFEDPTIKFRGRARYSQNLDLLVPFFDTPSLELENIEKDKFKASVEAPHYH